jgi:TPR repeat protein
MHLNGHSAADKNFERAHELAARGAALGCSDSKGLLGWLTYKGRGVFRNKQTGEQLMRESADAGSAWGQWALGLMYYQRQSRIPGHCSEETVRYFRMAAEQGHPEAQFRLGKLFQSGDGVALESVDLSEAVRYYRMAADQGYSAAQFELGRLYENGSGVAQDFAEAHRYYRMATSQGYQGAGLALCNLNIRLANDRGRV